jgi:fibronectin-binding autotransporter adhesin
MNHRPFVLAASIAALVAHSATAQTSTGWLGAGPGNLWSATANWSNGAPPGGDTNTRDLLFGNAFVTAGGTGSLISNNDLAGYTGFRITFEDTTAPTDPAFTINGNALTLSDFGGSAPRIENQSSSLQTIALTGTLTLNGGATGFAEVNPLNGNLLISNAVALAGSTQLRVSGNNLVTFSGAVSGTGGLVLNGGTTRLTTVNTISGGITLNTGATLEANTAAANTATFDSFMGAAGNSFTFDGGRLLMSAATTATVDRTLTGRNVTVNAGGAIFETQGAYTNFNEGVLNQLRFNGTSVLSGSGTLTKNGGGRLQFQNVTASGFTGAVVVNNGTLEASGGALGNASATNTVTVNGGNWALSGDASQAITLNGGAISTNGASRTTNGAINVTASSYIFLNEFWRDFDNAAPANILVRNMTVNGLVSGDDPLGIAVNRAGWTSNNGTVILRNAGNTYSGTLTVGKNLRLESNATAGVGSTLGTASIVLAGGSLNLRDNGAGSGGQLFYGNNVTVTDPTDIFNRGVQAASVTIDVNRASGTNTNNTVVLGSLTIGGQPINITGGNGYGVAFSGLAQTSGNATFNVNNASLSFYDAFIEDDGGGRSLTKNGNGVLNFGSETTYTGATIINGGSMVLNEIGRLAGTAAINLASGTSLTIDNSTTTLADRVIDAAPITMSGASVTLNSEIANPTSSVEQIGAVTLVTGTNTIAANRNNPGAISALTLASLTRQGAATVNFGGTNVGQPGTNSRVIITGQADTPFFGAWATVGGEFARYNTAIDAGMPLGVTAVESIDDPFTDALLTAADHIRLVGLDLTLSDNRSVNTVTFGNTADGRILNVGSHTLTLAGSGILVATNSSAINGTGGITAATPDLIVTNNAALNIAAPIKDNGAIPVSVLKTGTGTLTLSGASTFTGNISVAQGTLALSEVNDVGAPGSLGLNADVNLSTGAVPTVLQLTGPSDSTDHNLLIGTPGATVDVTTAGSNYTWNGTVVGSPLTKIGPGTFTLGGTASLTGNVSVTAGTLGFGGATTVAGTTTVSTGGTLRVSGGAQLAGDLNVGINGTVGTVTGAAGGILSVGSGSANSVNIGGRNNGVNASSTGTVDLSLADGFNTNVGNLRIQSDFGPQVDGAMSGTLRLPNSSAAVNSITVTNQFTVGDSPQAGGSSVATLALGGGSTTINTPTLLIGGRKVSANATIGAGGTLTLKNGTGRTTLNVGVNNVDTGTVPSTTFDLTGGTVIADLSSLTVGLKVGGGGVGKVTATLNLGAGSATDVDINAATGNAVRVGQYEYTAGGQPTDGQGNGTLIIGGGNVLIAAQATTSSAVVVGHFNNATTTITGGTNTATGVMTINGGNVVVNSAGTANAINIAQRTVVGTPGGTQSSNGTLNINGGSLTVNNAIVGNGGTAHANSTSTVNITGGTLNMQGKNITNITAFSFTGGTLKDVGTLNRTLVQTGESSLLDVALFNTTISNAGTYTVTDGNVNVAPSRTLAVAAGTTLNGTANMIINGTLTGALTVNAGATVGGAGSTAVLNLAGGTIAPGNSPGILGTGNLSLGGGNLAFELNGSTVGTGYDQINTTGTVSLTANTNLSLSFGGFVPLIGSSFTLINNDAADALSFSGGALFTYNNGAGIADDATFTTIEGMEFRLDYNGGSGNDVTLTTLVPEPTSAVTLLAGLGALLVTRRPRRQE